MKPLVYIEPVGNFGDDLNGWLWPRLIPECYGNIDGLLFLGIGTIIRATAPRDLFKVVFGAGYGYDEKPVPDERWHFRFVRGVETARALGLPDSMALTDGALLVRDFMQPSGGGTRAVFVPHHQSAYYADWGGICRDAGVDYMDSRRDVDTVLNAIRGARVVITESLHGAILADAFRVPWIAVNAYPQINEFKWRDWTGGVGLTHESHAISGVYDGSQRSWLIRGPQWLSGVRRRGTTDFTLHPIPKTRTNAETRDRAVKQLRLLAENGGAQRLSDERVCDELLERLREHVVALRREYPDLVAQAQALNNRHLPGSH
ncbi:MAG: polysaccharide pyruvyl transferase family protein [Gemmatimonas sp.]